MNHITARYQGEQICLFEYTCVSSEAGGSAREWGFWFEDDVTFQSRELRDEDIAISVHLEKEVCTNRIGGSTSLIHSFLWIPQLDAEHLDLRLCGKCTSLPVQMRQHSGSATILSALKPLFAFCVRGGGRIGVENTS